MKLTGRLWAALWVAIFAAVMILPAAVHAEPFADWRKARAAAYTAFVAANRDAAKAAAAVVITAPAAAMGPLDAPPVIWPVSAKPMEVWDGPEAPQLVLVPPGEITVGPKPGSKGLRGNEPAPKRVRVAKPLLAAKYPVTVGEFARFIAETHHNPGPQCWTYEDEDGHIRQGRGWSNPGFATLPSQPVLCVSQAEVQAYIAWLKQKTGFTYRQLTEAEYEYVNRAGAATDFWWGDEAGANHSNCDGCGSLWDNRRTSPVGSFAANDFGLYDTAGDTWVWTSDCYVDAKTPLLAGGGCTEHVIKGGAWHGGTNSLKISSRFHHTPDTHSATLGFRLAREP
jgi:formylglycine-generating enzyme required for sulfatase activity